MDEAESSDSDRRENRLCSLSTKLCCVVGSRSFSTAMGGEVSCGRQQRFRRSEQVAATRRWSVLLPLPFKFNNRLGVRSLANASRARQFNPYKRPTPPGVG